MNIALGAFILTLLFLPAVAYRLAINREENLKELLSTFSLTDSIWVFSIAPIFIHLVMLGFMLLIGSEVKFDLILSILYSNKDYKIANHAFSVDVMKFMGYCFIAIVIGYACGLLTNFLEEKYNLLTRLLGLGNEWYQVFEGNIQNAAGERYNINNIAIVYVDVLSNTKEATVIYSGILVNYYYKPKSTELDYLVLQGAQRRDFRKEFLNGQDAQGVKTNYYSNQTSPPVRIPGEYFIVPMKEVLNVNVSYVSVD